jgi:CheY-like chemotaxis protein
MDNFATAICRPRSVLVVDTDLAVIALLSMILEGPKSIEKPKMRVLRAHSVKEAMDILNRPSVAVDLVLCNKSLSESAGQSFADQVAALRPQLPVMFMSAITAAQRIQIHRTTSGTGLMRAVVSALEHPCTVWTTGGSHCTAHSMRAA